MSLSLYERIQLKIQFKNDFDLEKHIAEVFFPKHTQHFNNLNLNTLVLKEFHRVHTEWKIVNEVIRSLEKNVKKLDKLSEQTKAELQLPELQNQLLQLKEFTKHKPIKIKHYKRSKIIPYIKLLAHIFHTGTGLLPTCIHTDSSISKKSALISNHDYKGTFFDFLILLTPFFHAINIYVEENTLGREAAKICKEFKPPLGIGF